MKTSVLAVTCTIIVAVSSLSAHAVSIGYSDSPLLLLGTIDQPASSSPDHEAEMINYLLTQTFDGTGAVDGHNNSGLLTVDNLNTKKKDKKSEVYTLESGASVPSPAALATDVGSWKDDEGNNTFVLLSSYDWLIAKYGNSSEAYYVGGLPTGSLIELPAKTTRLTTGNGLSHISLYNLRQVPDGSATLILLGLSGLGLGILRKTVA